MLDKCQGCDHRIGEHFQSVDGVVRCLHSESGHSTSGIIGMPWTSRCDCVNYKSECTTRYREEKAKQDAEHDAAMDHLHAVVMEKLKAKRLESNDAIEVNQRPEEASTEQD